VIPRYNPTAEDCFNILASSLRFKEVRAPSAGKSAVTHKRELKPRFVRNRKFGKEEIVKKPLILCLLAFYHLPLLAQTTEKSAVDATQQTPSSLQILYTNLGKKGHLYYPDGLTVSGPNSSAVFSFFIAMPFTPSLNSHVSEVRVAVQYLSGANQVNLSIYEDSGGVPGTLLAGPVTITNLPNANTCCRLTVADFTPVAVSGGVRYWVVANTPATGVGSDFEGLWQPAANISVPLALDNGTSWFPFQGVLLPSGVVLGTIP